MNRLYILLMGLAVLACTATSCSEEEGVVDEYANWQQVNDAFVLSLQDSVKANPSQWRRIKCYSLDQAAEGNPWQSIYVKVLRPDAEVQQVNSSLQLTTTDECPLFTDSVRVAYRGRLLPTASYPDGRAFDQTYVGSYSRSTTATASLLVSSLVDGFQTAVMKMRRGERWLVYIPYQLGYKENSQTNIPACSTLVFDVDLFDFCRPDGKLRPYRKPSL